MKALFITIRPPGEVQTERDQRIHLLGLLVEADVVALFLQALDDIKTAHPVHGIVRVIGTGNKSDFLLLHVHRFGSLPLMLIAVMSLKVRSGE